MKNNWPTKKLGWVAKIVEKLSAAQEYKKQLLEQKSKLEELFNSVLHKSMKGRRTGVAYY